MNELSAYTLGLISGGLLVSSVLIGHYDNWQSFGPVVGTILGTLVVVVMLASLLEDRS